MKPILETERLQLVPFEMNDLDLLHQTFTEPFVREYIWDNEIIPVERTKEVLQGSEQHFENDRWGLWKILVKSDGSYAGFAGLWFFWGEPQPQLLYGLIPGKKGYGYATEASTAIIGYAFNELKFTYLIAACDTPNKASLKVCERLNMKVVEEKEVKGRPTVFYRIDR